MICDAFIPRAATPAPDDDGWYRDDPSVGGNVNVNPTTAMQVTTVLACVRVRAQSLGQLPLHLMTSQGKKRRKAVEHPLYDVLHSKPNDWQTWQEFAEMAEGHITLRGNSYALIRPGSRGAVDQLIPLHPDRMQVFRLGGGIDGGRIGYLYRDLQGKPYRLTQDQVFHLRSMSLNDCVGLSAIAEGRYTVELAQRGVQHGIRFYRNAARPSGVISMGKDFRFEDEDHEKRMKKSWRDAHTGDDLFTTAILEGGAKWQQMGLSNEDAQFLEMLRYNATQICQLLDVPPHMIGMAIEKGGNTYANVEQTDLAFMKHNVLPRTTRWEQAIYRDLIVQPDDGTGTQLYVKFGLEALLRADSKTRAAFFQIMLRNKVYTRNEVRELEDLDPVEGGDEFDEPQAVLPAPAPVPRDDGDAGSGEEGNSLAGVSASEVIVQTPVFGPVERLGTDGASLVAAAAERGSAESWHRILSAVESADSRDPDDGSLLRAWIAYAVEGFVAAELRELEQRVPHAAENRETFDDWVRDFWGGRQRSYAQRALAPVLAATRSKIDSAAMAAEICDSAIAELTSGDPIEILKRWRADRAENLTDLLWEDLNHDQ